MGAGHVILLVGEGNFSFAASLCDRLPSDTRIVATCYESEEAAARHEGAADNIEYLLEKGAEVHFLVDCTNLQECPSLCSRRFDQIVFNFPHCGRKAGVKRNRELLAKFFLSCAHVLAASGEVHVTLCKGQGGTAADHPPRSWHDSWQVVAMAAGADFILTGVRPFDGARYGGYASTGYRSQDKAFRLDGALTHVFARSPPITRPKPVTVETEVGDERCRFQLPEELADMIDRGFLRQGSTHPVKVVKDRLLKLIGAEAEVRELEDEFPVLTRFRPGLDVPESEVYFLARSDRRTPDPGGALCLRPSLTQHLPELRCRPGLPAGTVRALSGAVFRRCRVSPLAMPAFHQLLLLSGDSGRLASALEKAVAGLAGVAEVSLEEEEEEEGAEGGRGRWVVRLGEAVLPVAAVWEGRTPGSPASLAVNLDLLAMAVNRLDDWRLLWSPPPAARSLHPPCYTHDVSFWAGAGPAELDLHALARRVSAGAVESVELIERYTQPRTGRRGCCYRLTYRSCDRALSSQRAAQMQLELRGELQRIFSVTLR